MRYDCSHRIFLDNSFQKTDKEEDTCVHRDNDDFLSFVCTPTNCIWRRILNTKLAILNFIGGWKETFCVYNIDNVICWKYFSMGEKDGAEVEWLW